ncbi:hypothetical protein CTV96_12945 [Bacillus altitudinis]|nr:hypothetical protein CTV96_12945 [Bacillus altitudinis]PKQ85127.1 hypothetical protein CTV98_011480 [Bacillus altitudinis]
MAQKKKQFLPYPKKVSVLAMLTFTAMKLDKERTISNVKYFKFLSKNIKTPLLLKVKVGLIYCSKPVL